MQGLGEFVELQLADLESLAARLELESLGREAGLLFGNSLLPQRQGFLPSRRRELPVEHLPEPFPVGLKVGLKLGPGGGGTGGFGLRALLQANMPVAEAVTLAAGTSASAAAALGAIGLAEVAAPELPTSAVASAIAAGCLDPR